MDALGLPVVGILVEKPLADAATGGRRILDAAKSRKLPLVVPHGWFARDIAQEIADRLLGGEIGTLQLMEVQCRKWDIMSAGIHWVHFFLSVIPADEVALVMASADRSTRTYRDGVQVETMSVTYVQMRSGTRMVMQTGDDTEVVRGETLFRFFGEAGTLEWCLQENAYSLLNRRHPNGETVEVSIRDPRRPHHRYVDSLAKQMDTGSPDYTIPNASLTALEICEAAYVSANNRCRVTFPFQAFTVPPDTGWEPGAPYGGEGGGRDGRKL
jgi:predicted dehydrogenase